MKYTITLLFCAVILFTSCKKDSVSDSDSPLVGGPRISKSYTFTNAFVDYNVSYRYGNSSDNRYTTVMNFIGDHQYKFNHLDIDLQSPSTSTPSLKIEMDGVYMPDMFTNFVSGDIKVNGTTFDSKTSRIAIVEMNDAANRMTILFTLQSPSTTAVYTGQLVLQ
jgi:hypothetical protein